MHITNPKLTSLGPNIDLYSLTHLFIHSFITASTVYIQQKRYKYKNKYRDGDKI